MSTATANAIPSRGYTTDVYSDHPNHVLHSALQYSHRNSQTSAVIVTLTTEEGMQHILDGMEFAKETILQSRKQMISYFKEELFILKASTEIFAQWTLDANDSLSVSTKTNDDDPHVSKSNEKNYHGSHYEGEYSTMIRGAFSNHVLDFEELSKVILLALKYNYTVALPSNILQNIEYFSQTPENKIQLDTYCKYIVDKFLIMANYT